MQGYLRVGDVKMSPDRSAVLVEIIASNPILSDQPADLLSKQASDMARKAALEIGFHERAADNGFEVPPHGVTIDGLLAGSATLDGQPLPYSHPKNQVHHYRGVIKIR